MQKKWKIGLAVLAGGFVLFFTARLIYGFISYPDSGGRQNSMQYQDYQTNDNVQNSDNLQLRKNYASFKQKSADTATVVIDQKYEKKATLNSYSSDFDADSKNLRSVIESDQALIQYENISGLDGSRTVFLSIGVPPLKFDTMIEKIRQIGRLNYIQINKTDKTNEYKELNAKLASLTKTRDSLLRLKTMQAKVEELVRLEEKILEVESQIQDLGVNLGQYDAENEFCTVDVTLTENLLKGQKIGIGHRLFTALEWTLKYYTLLILLAALGLLMLLILFKLLEKLSLFKNLLPPDQNRK